MAASALGKGREKAVNDFEKRYDERLRSCVVVQYTVKYYLDQEKKVAGGLVVDDEGTIILNGFDIPNNVGIDQLTNFEVFPLWKRSNGYEAEYLGQDNFLGFHYLRVKGDIVKEIKPISAFGTCNPKRGEYVWGFSVIEFQNDSYESAFHRSQVSFIDHAPYRVGWTQNYIGTEGMPAFDKNGNFAGIGIMPLNIPYQIRINDQNYATQLTPSGRTERFLLAEDFFHYLKGAPESKTGDPVPSIGILGIEPLSPKALQFFGLKEASGIVVGNVVEDGPANKAGFLPGDIILGINGTPIPFFVASYAYADYVALSVREKKIGDQMTFQVYRNGQTLNITTTIEAAPISLSQAKRKYLPEYGMAIREYTLDDGLKRNVYNAGAGGVIVDFVKYNSPADDAGVKPGDWIKKIDDKDVTTFDSAIALIDQEQQEKDRQYFILLVQRDSTTRVLRVRK